MTNQLETLIMIYTQTSWGWSGVMQRCEEVAAVDGGRVSWMKQLRIFSCNTNPLRPLLSSPHLSSSTPSPNRHEILFILQPAACLCCSVQACGCARKKKHAGIVYTNGLHECARARQNMKPEPQRQNEDFFFPFLYLWRFEGSGWK